MKAQDKKYFLFNNALNESPLLAGIFCGHTHKNLLLRDRSLIAGRREGGYKMVGGASEVLTLQKRGVQKF